MSTKFMMLLFAVTIFSFSKKQTQTKIIFFGDSITQAGVKPDGYITQLDSILIQKKLKGSFALSGAGIGGNKIYDLYLRMEEDVLEKNPDVVVIYIGVNDVWHKRTSGTGTDADKFEKFYRAVIKKLKDKNIKVYLCTPAVIGERTDFSNPLDGDLNHYSNIIRKLATDTGSPLIDLRKAFLDYIKNNNPENKERGILTTDGVHLNYTGNTFVAQAMLAGLQQGVIK